MVRIRLVRKPLALSWGGEGGGGRNSANFGLVCHVSQLIPNIPLVDREITVKFVGTACSVSFLGSFYFLGRDRPPEKS